MDPRRTSSGCGAQERCGVAIVTNTRATSRPASSVPGVPPPALPPLPLPPLPPPPLRDAGSCWLPGAAPTAAASSGRGQPWSSPSAYRATRPPMLWWVSGDLGGDLVLQPCSAKGKAYTSGQQCPQAVHAGCKQDVQEQPLQLHTCHSCAPTGCVICCNDSKDLFTAAACLPICKAAAATPIGHLSRIISFIQTHLWPTNETSCRLGCAATTARTSSATRRPHTSMPGGGAACTVSLSLGPNLMHRKSKGAKPR